MRLWIHRYTLVPKKRLSGVARDGAREGALLRVDDGFADLHPWPELGDLTLDEQLALLTRGEPTRQTRASLRLAEIDGKARRRGVSLFDGMTIPESHWPGNEPPPGFDTIKIKGLQPIPPHVRVRIDFNATLTAEKYLEVAKTLPKDQIDFIEDPCPYDEGEWRALQTATGLRLALDLAVQPPTASRERRTDFVIVHKPAVQSEWPRHHDIVVTSYMDHPVGQFGAAFVAATHAVNPRCGLFTHVLYEPDAFLERVRSDGARLLPPGGTGIGFDELLENLPWTSIG